MTHDNEKIIQINSGTIIRAIIIAALFAIFYYLRDIILVLILAVIIASAVEPGTRWFVRRGFPRILAVILIYFAALVLLVGTFYFLLLPFLSQSASFLSSLPSYFKDVQVWNPLQNNSLVNSNSAIQGFSHSFSIDQIIREINDTVVSYSNGFFSTASDVFGGILSLVLVAVLSFYLSVESDGISDFLKMVTPFKHEHYVLDLWRRSRHKIGLWMQGQIVLSIILMVLVFLGLTLLKVQDALLLAVLAGIFEIIPLFGPILSAIPAVAITFINSSVASGFLVIGFYIIIHQFENQLIYPLVVRKIVGVPPLVSIIALLAGFKLAGFIGLIISVPIATFIIEYLNDLEKSKRALAERLQSSSDK